MRGPSPPSLLLSAPLFALFPSAQLCLVAVSPAPSERGWPAQLSEKMPQVGEGRKSSNFVCQLSRRQTKVEGAAAFVAFVYSRSSFSCSEQVLEDEKRAVLLVVVCLGGVFCVCACIKTIPDNTQGTLSPRLFLWLVFPKSRSVCYSC